MLSRTCYSVIRKHTKIKPNEIPDGCRMSFLQQTSLLPAPLFRLFLYSSVCASVVLCFSMTACISIRMANVRPAYWVLQTTYAIIRWNIRMATAITTEADCSSITGKKTGIQGWMIQSCCTPHTAHTIHWYVDVELKLILLRASGRYHIVSNDIE